MYLDVFVKEDGSTLLEDVDRLGGKQAASASLCAERVHLGVATHIVSEAAPYILALHDNLDMLGSIAAYLVVEDGIVCATKDDGVNLVVLAQQVVDVATDEVVRTFALCLAILN